MKLLIVTQYYPPETGPAAKLHELALRLTAKGHSLTVLTAMPNYPGGRIFDGYRGRLRMQECLQGIRVIRTWVYASKSSRPFVRLLSYCSFLLSSVLLGCWRLGRHDVALIESPPLFLVPAGLFLSRLARAKSIMMVSDIWPDILVRMGHATGGLSLKAMLWLERFGYTHADVVSLTNPGARQQIQDRFPQIKTTIISNGVDLNLFSPDKRSIEVRQGLGTNGDTFLVGYCGLHGHAQGLEVILDAAEQLRSFPHIKFVMIGEGPVKAHLVKESARRKLPNLVFLNARPKQEMPAIVASCDICIVPLASRLPGTMPSKVYETLASGVPPLVAKGCEGDALVTRHQVGLTFEPMNGTELASAVKRLASDKQLCADMSLRARKLAQRFDRNVIAERTESIIKALADNCQLPDVTW